MRILVAAIGGALLISVMVVPGWGVLAQESAAPAEARPSRADTLLLRAIRHQGTEEGAIRDFVIRLACEVTRRDGVRTEEQDVTLTRFLRLLPEERFRSDTIVSGNIIKHGFDGKRYWLDDGESVTSLFGPRYEKDRAEIKAEIRDTRLLLRLFFLSNLEAPGTRFRFVGRGVARAWGEEYPCDILHRQDLDPESTRRRFTIWLHQKTGRLIKVRILAAGKPARDPDLIFSFHYDEVEQPRCGKVLFPMKIEVREQEADGTDEVTILKATLLDEKGVELNNGIKDVLFKKPQ